MNRKFLWLTLCVVLLVTVQAYLLSQASTVAAQGGGTPVIEIPKVSPFEFNGDVRNLPNVPAKPRTQLNLVAPKSIKPAAGGQQPSPEAPTVPLTAPMPSPIQNFPGLSHNDIVTGGLVGAGWPPDTNGDVGMNHYIQAVNDAYAIYDKTGTQVAAFTENSLFTGAGNNPCGTGHNFGDPVVVYDQFADRWILTNFAFTETLGITPTVPFYQGFAVSKTSDPVAGGWWLYPVRIDNQGGVPFSTLNDYGKFGIWNDGCLYMGANGFFFGAGAYNGAIFGSLSKTDMENGLPLTAAFGFLPYPANDVFTMIPGNISGARQAASLPPTGTPEYFASESILNFQYLVRKFTKGANCGAGGSLGAPTAVSQVGYNPPCSASTCAIVPQPLVTITLDTVDDRLMQKVQYRRIGSAESLWVALNVCRTGTTYAACTANTGMLWAQLNVTGGTVAASPLQQQKYAPDTTLYRWMGSLAVDHVGDMAIGYSTSNGQSPNFPSIAYAGRLVGDTANLLPQTEVQLIAGLGSQSNTCGGAACTRWGDYSAMSIDPADDCTFWYTNEYYDSPASGLIGDWHTRIGSFKFPNCNTPTAVGVDDFQASSSTPAAVSPEGVAVGALALLVALFAGALGLKVWRPRPGR